MYYRQHQIPLIIFLTVFVFGSAFLIYNQYSKTIDSKIENSPSIDRVGPSAKLDTLCRCGLMLFDGTRVQLLDPVTGKRTPTVTTAGNGEGGGSPIYVGASPSGQQVVLHDTVHYKLLIVNSVTGKTVRALPIDANQFLSAWRWSPDELTILFVLSRQINTHVVEEPTPVIQELVVLTPTQHKTLSAPVTADNDGQYTLLSINDLATDVIVGWSTLEEVVLYHQHTGGKYFQMRSPLLSPKPEPANSAIAISAIHNGHALLTFNNQILNVDVTQEVISQLSGLAWSVSPVSPMSIDGQILYAQSLRGTAHGQLMRYLTSTNTGIELHTPFDNGDGFRMSFWLPGKQFILVRDSYHQRWLAYNIRFPQMAPDVVTISGFSENDTLLGAFELSQ